MKIWKRDPVFTLCSSRQVHEGTENGIPSSNVLWYNFASTQDIGAGAAVGRQVQDNDDDDIIIISIIIIIISSSSSSSMKLVKTDPVLKCLFSSRLADEVGKTGSHSQMFVEQ